MQHTTSFNRNLMDGKRRNKGITKYGKYKNLSERLKAEVEARQQYEQRVNNQEPNKKGFYGNII
jgi:hypothetical protein